MALNKYLHNTNDDDNNNMALGMDRLKVYVTPSGFQTMDSDDVDDVSGHNFDSCDDVNRRFCRLHEWNGGAPAGVDSLPDHLSFGQEGPRPFHHLLDAQPIRPLGRRSAT